jgi:hypothetical protein
MSKKAMVEELIALGTDLSKAALNKKSEEELAEMLEVARASKAEDETKEVLLKAENVTTQVLYETSHQLRIFTEFIYHVKNEGAKVEVINEGYGDAYIGTKPTKVGDKENRLLTKESRVIEDAKILYMIAASQPVIKIREIE